jgi:UDP-glucose 4-epimerase
VLEAAKKLTALLGASVKPVYQEPRPGDVRHSLADITRAGTFLGYQPGVNFATGLKRTLEWFRKNKGHIS